MIVWALLVPLTIGFTITQVVFWWIGVLLRFCTLPVGSGWRKRVVFVVGSVVTAAVGALLVIFLAERQLDLNPWAPIFYKNDIVGPEQTYRRPVAAETFAPPRLQTTLSQMFLYPFVAPTPGYSKITISYGYFSLSLEEHAQAAFSGLRMLFFVAVGVVLYLPLVGCKFRRPFEAAMLLGILSQLVLHLLYGREFVLYSLNWIGIVVALLVVTVAHASMKAQRVWIVLVAVTLPLMLVNNQDVLRRVVAEMRYGLEMNVRTSNGEPISPLPYSESRLSRWLDSLQ
jgi:hypothetical protein